ncbi:hypothetical protein HC776_02140 [bacterium]|nr:hypothetical protein [bacterium]
MLPCFEPETTHEAVEAQKLIQFMLFFITQPPFAIFIQQFTQPLLQMGRRLVMNQLLRCGG